jgi:soluble lytic murein transglycosylase-like protein
MDQELVEAIVRVESNFDPNAVSKKNCKGLMQLHPDTARRFGVTDIFDPEQNMDGGVRYFRFLLDEFDEDLDLALAAYNAGENAVKKYEGIPPYKETRNYVKRITSIYDSTSLKSRSEDLNPVSRRVFRVPLPNGKVLFTNTPMETISDND